MLFREIFNTVTPLPATHNDGAWSEYLAGKGYSVTARTALKVAAVFRCVDLISKTIASLPMNLYRETEDGNKEKAKDHPLYKILHMLPNKETTAFDFWRMYIVNMMLTRGAYAKIVRNRNGFILGLLNIPTACVAPRKNIVNDEKYIDVYLDDGQMERLRPGEYMYTPGFRFDSVKDPEDPIKIAKDVLELTMSLNGFAEDYFKNGANLGSVLEAPGPVGDKAYDRLIKDWDEKWAGVRNQQKTIFLEEGLKLNKLDANLEEAQALESRKFAVIEICRIFGVPPHKVFELDRATFNNIEELNIEFVQEALVPPSVQIEQTIYKDCLTEREQQNMYAKIILSGLLRGNTEARGNFYHQMLQDGVFSANNVLDLEDMNRISEEDGGNALLVNGNMISRKNAINNLPKSMQK